MSNAWDDMRKAKEGTYFEQKNREALERLASKKEDKPRLSPITGEPMEQIALHGVIVDRCKTSGGIWLDAGELEQIVDAMKGEHPEGESGWITSFVKALTMK